MSFMGAMLKAGMSSDGNHIDVFSSNSQLMVDGGIFHKTTVTTKNTAGNVSYTPGELVCGLILRDPNGSARTDKTPTASALASYIKNLNVGSSFTFYIRNTADAAETITLEGDTGVTVSGTGTIAQSNCKCFLAVCTAVGLSPTFTVYSIGTFVF